MNPTTASDWQLIAWIKTGKTHLFSHLVERYKNKGMAVAMSVTQNASVAEDVLQDAFIGAFNNLAHYQPSGSFGAWLYRIILNASLNAVNKQKRHFFTADDDVADTSAEDDVDLSLQGSHRRHHVLRLLEAMPPSEALVLRLFYLMDMSISDIHGVTDLSHANIKTLLHRARKRFRQQWQNLEGEGL